ncbi:MAG: hypothetical protein AABY22_07635 [Nanoarchaeota archaeon]
MEQNLENTEEISLYEKLIKEQEDNIEIEQRKILALMRQLIVTEQKVEQKKIELKELENAAN